MPKKQPATLIPSARIERSILAIRGQKVLLDVDLADLYGVETRTLVQAVKRNRSRFPSDFMFQLSKAELEDWRSQFVMSNPGAKMGLRRPPLCLHRTGRCHALQRVEKPTGSCREYRNYTRVCATSRTIGRACRTRAQAGGIGEEIRRTIPRRLRCHPPTYDSAQFFAEEINWFSRSSRR